jgi:hypothetical protein
LFDDGHVWHDIMFGEEGGSVSVVVGMRDDSYGFFCIFTILSRFVLDEHEMTVGQYRR